MRVIRCVAVVLVAALPVSSGGQAIDDVAARSLIRQRVDSGKNPAVVLGVLENGRRRVIAYGTSGSPSGVLDGNTVFEIGSITKVFTSTILADMIRRGEVKLDDPVMKYLSPQAKIPSRNGREITLGDLAMQQSGLPRQPDNMHPADPSNPYADYSEEQMFEFLSRYQLPRDPGAQFEYSNIGVGLLGNALGRRAGMSYETLVTERVLKPLGMNDTRITLNDGLRARLARGHDQAGAPASNWDVPTIAGAGALRSTVNDMLKFAGAAMSSAGPLAQAIDDAQQPRRSSSLDGSMRIGLNWFTQRAGPVEIIWHNGGTGGYRSYLGIDRAHQRAVVLLTNSGNGVDDIGRLLLMNAVQTPETRAFVNRLGRDTMSVERFTRYADHLEADMVFRNPRVGVVHVVARYPKGDTITSFELATRLPSQAPAEPPQFERITVIRDDSMAQTTVRRAGKVDSALSARFTVRPRALPYVSLTTAFYDHAMRIATRLGVDSLAYDEYGAGGNPPNFPGFVARRGKGESIINWGGTPLYATADDRGRITRLDFRATTVKTVSELVPDVDIAAIAKAWNEAKPAGLPSPRDTARATVGGSMIVIDYGRPSKRGRQVFGGLIPLDSIWRLGANAATQLILNSDLRIGEATIPAGSYSLWMVPSAGTSRLIVNKQSGQWGTQYDSTQGLVTIPLATRRLSAPVEQMTIAIVSVAGGDGTLRITWDDREFTVRIRSGP